LNQWDTADWIDRDKAAPGAANHPCVVISPNYRCTNKDIEHVNIIAASSHRTNRLPRDNEFLLDAADGMDWETLVRLDVIHTVEKKELRPRKQVSRERRRGLGQKLIKVFGLVVD
jgi:hypothetical protein